MSRLPLVAFLVLALPSCASDDPAPGNQDSADIKPATQDVWLSFQPTQCGTNPWEQGEVQVPEDIGVGGELAQIVGFLTSKKVTIDEIGFMNPAELTFQCESCSCPRGDRLVVKASGKANIKKLEKLDFVRFEGAIGISPIQCGGNPWEQLAGDSEGGAADLGDGDDKPAISELQQIKDWASTIDAEIDELGFALPVELTAQCESCSCSRGDFLLITAKDAPSALAFKGEGFADL